MLLNYSEMDIPSACLTGQQTKETFPLLSVVVVYLFVDKILKYLLQASNKNTKQQGTKDHESSHRNYKVAKSVSPQK